MNKAELKIGIALSGGGIRATIFHLGVFKYLAEAELLNAVTHISSVSGASLCVALIFAKNNNKWPSNREYLEKVLPEIEKTILKNNIQSAALLRLPISPEYWGNHVGLIAKMMRNLWQINGSLQDIGKLPLWDVNCTTFETGKCFRFNQEKMGDYLIGHALHPDISIADAAAASAGFPVLIGPYKLDTRKYQWDKTPREQCYYLWDGGVYDNLGLESLYKPETGLASDINYLIISNASGSSGYKERKANLSAENLKRLLDITMDQVGALRSREVFSHVLTQDNGLYINIGNAAEKILKDSKVDPETARHLIASCMSADQALKVRNYATTLDSPTSANYQLILRHGYENAECTYAGFAKF